MFNFSKLNFNGVLRASILCLTAFCWIIATNARAGLTFNINLSHFNANGTNYYFTISGSLSTNGNGSNPPFGDYLMVSPGFPGSNGTSANYHFDTNGFDFESGGSTFYGDFPSAMNGMTNGNWTIFVTNLAGTSVSTFTFNITAPTLTTNDIPDVFVTFPTNDATGIDNEPTFTWVGGSTNYDGEDITLSSANNNSFRREVLTAVTVTNWQFPGVIVPPGTFNFSIRYNKSTSLMLASTPTGNFLQPISSWTSTAQLNTSFQSQFTIPEPTSTGPTLSQGHILVLHYTWDGNFSDPLSASQDVSGSGNSAGFGTGGGPNGGVTLTNDAVEGGQAVQFHDPDGGSLGALGLLGQNSVMSALASSFTVSCWIKTTQDDFGSDNAFAFDGAGIVSADVGGVHNDVVPMALTGSTIGFNTGGNSDQTLNSSASVNDGVYHLITVTRDQTSGNKAIYIDGELDTNGIGTTNLLSDPQMVAFGSQIDAANDNLSTADFHNGFNGDMDDLQIYAGVLSSNEVAFLFNNPGTPAPNLSGNGLVVHYTFDDTNNIGVDSSGNGFNLDFNGGDGVVGTNDAEAGGGAAFFDGFSYLTFNSAPTNVLAAFAGDFTLALWIKTTDVSGNDGDLAWEDAGIVAADIPNQHNDIIPMALTGGEIGFLTGGNSDDTINSTVDINDGSYHQVVVTRSQATGQKQIFIDGVLNTNDFATTNLLSDPVNIGIGTGIDASQTDPSQISNNQFYQGELDDIQVYNRVLSTNEVAFLFNNPGQTISTNETSPPPPPFSGTVTLNMGVDRQQDASAGDVFFLFPGLSVNPPPDTTDLVSSPTGQFTSHFSSTDGGSGSSFIGSLDDLINECTNGLWTLTINQGSANAQLFHFKVSVAGLTTNLLAKVTILVPTNGAVNVSANTPFQWAGEPPGFAGLNSSILVNKQTIAGNDYVQLNLPITATNWPSPPTLDPGTNLFMVQYSANNVTNFTFSTPVDVEQNQITNLVTQVGLNAIAQSVFTVPGGATPITLTNVSITGTNFQFSFLSQSGLTNSVQFSTNLVSPNWLLYTNVPGDGTVKTLQVPLSIFGSSAQGFVRVRQ